MPSAGSYGERLDLAIRQGACLKFSVAIANPDGTPVDLAGASAAAKLRRAYSDATEAAAFAVSIVLPDTIELSLTHTQTASLAAGGKPTDPDSVYLWDMEIQWPDGCITSPLYGEARVKAEVTK